MVISGVNWSEFCKGTIRKGRTNTSDQEETCSVYRPMRVLQEEIWVSNLAWTGSLQSSVLQEEIRSNRSILEPSPILWKMHFRLWLWLLSPLQYSVGLKVAIIHVPRHELAHWPLLLSSCHVMSHLCSYWPHWLAVLLNCWSCSD